MEAIWISWLCTMEFMQHPTLLWCFRVNNVQEVYIEWSWCTRSWCIFSWNLLSPSPKETAYGTLDWWLDSKPSDWPSSKSWDKQSVCSWHLSPVGGQAFWRDWHHFSVHRSGAVIGHIQVLGIIPWSWEYLTETAEGRQGRRLQLHLSSVMEAVPSIIVLGCKNYSKYMPVYVKELRKLQEMQPGDVQVSSKRQLCSPTFIPEKVQQCSSGPSPRTDYQQRRKGVGRSDWLHPTTECLTSIASHTLCYRQILRDVLKSSALTNHFGRYTMS